MSKHILLIGGSGGIGKALSTLLTADGYQVTIISREEKEKQVSTNHIAHDVCDFQRDLPPLESPLHGLVFLPGTITLKPFKQLSMEDFHSDMNINYFAAVKVVQHYLPAFEKESSIVLISSVAASLGMAFHASIAGAKAAIEGFGLALAAELAPNIRVNIVAPSLTDTPLAGKLLDSDAKKEASGKRHAMGRVGSADDIAHMIAFLLSENSSWMTGQVLHVDGGLSSTRPL